MEYQAYLTIAILIAVIILFVTEKIPLALTSILSMLAIYFSGILSFSDAFSGFSNSALIMVIGMSVFGSAFSATGLIDLVVKGLQKLFFNRKRFSEKMFILESGVVSAILSMFLNPMLVTTLFMNIIDVVSSTPGSKITRRNTTFPVAIASVYGGTFTSVSLATVILTSSLLEESPVGRTFRFFEPAIIGLPCFLVFLLFFATIGHGMEQRVFRFDDSCAIQKDNTAHAVQGTPLKRGITLATLAVCIALFIFSDFALGAIAFAGAAVLLLTGCVEFRAAFREVDWSTTILVATSIGFAKGIDASGAGKLIAEKLIQLAGPIVSTPLGVCVLALVIASLLSNFMSNTSTALILVPIFINVAERIGAPILPVVMAAGVGTGLAVATPICTSHITLTTSVGYRFKDYFCVGGVLNILTIMISAFSLYVFYLV